AIVTMTGVLPSMAFSRGTDLLTPWVRAGGLLVWGGATIGYYSGVENQKIQTSPSPNGPSLRERGADLILGTGIATFPWEAGRTATQQSEISAALGIEYQLASGRIKIGAVAARGGNVLGWYDNKYSSVSYLPSGAGGFLIFGGEVRDAASLSRDVAQLLVSGVMYGSGEIASMGIYLPNIGPTTTISW